MPAPNVAVINWSSGYRQYSKVGAKYHRAKFNNAFCDGHVELEDFNKPFVASDDYLRRWNIDNQPHREAWDNFPY
jgi:prepilin-type processing-associated H-X9-DG protein